MCNGKSTFNTTKTNSSMSMNRGFPCYETMTQAQANLGKTSGISNAIKDRVNLFERLGQKSN